MRSFASAAFAVGLIGCDDCGTSSLAIRGLCEPRIQVGTRAELAIVYETDVGPDPVGATSANVGDESIATLTQGPTTDRISITGIAVGQTTIELLLQSDEEPAWFFLTVEPGAPAYECDGHDPPDGFFITGRGTPPQ
ncbi:MAG: hypothetical protein AB7T06_27845 [Kofleriaceae bacterium]